MQQCPIVGITNIGNAVFEEYTPVKILTKNAVEANAAKQDSMVKCKSADLFILFLFFPNKLLTKIKNV